MEEISILNFYNNYGLNDIMCYSTVYNFIKNNRKMLENQDIIKTGNKKKLRKNYMIIRPVKLRVLIKDYYYGDGIVEIVNDEII
jgi:hypothetical protein